MKKENISPIEEFISGLERKAVKAEIDSVISEKLLSDSDYKITANERKLIKEPIAARYEYELWIDNVLSTDLSKIDSFIPNDKQTELFDFLSLSFSYRATLKAAFNKDSLILKEHIEKQYPGSLNTWKKRISSLHPELMPLYLHFKAVIDEARKEGVSPAEKIENEVSDTAKKSTFGTVISHSPKFSHPAATSPKIYVTKKRSVDGFIKTGNSSVDFDLHINATYLKVYRFLSLVINGKSIKDHLEADNSSVLSFFSSDQKLIEKWNSQLLQCLNSQNEETNQLIKQVYFPKEKGGYHLLSILFPSGLAFELKQRIEKIKHTDEVILAKRDEKKGRFNENGYGVIPNITLQRHGGDHPKNISALSNKYQDVYLLDSSPPKLKKLTTKPPKKNFFADIWRKAFLSEFRGLHRVLRAENTDVPQIRTDLIAKYLLKNKRVETELVKLSKVKGDIKESIQPHHLSLLFGIITREILYKLIERVYLIRNEGEGWCQDNKYKSLPENQKILLDQKYLEKRIKTDEWFEDFTERCINWIIASYKIELGDKQLPISKNHKELMQKAITNDKRGLL